MVMKKTFLCALLEMGHLKHASLHGSYSLACSMPLLCMCKRSKVAHQTSAQQTTKMKSYLATISLYTQVSICVNFAKLYVMIYEQNNSL